MPRSRSRGGWQMRGGRCVTNSSRPGISATGAMEAAGGDQGMCIHSGHVCCLLYVSPLMYKGHSVKIFSVENDTQAQFSCSLMHMFLRTLLMLSAVSTA